MTAPPIALTIFAALLFSLAYFAPDPYTAQFLAAVAGVPLLAALLLIALDSQNHNDHEDP